MRWSVIVASAVVSANSIREVCERVVASAKELPKDFFSLSHCRQDFIGIGPSVSQIARQFHAFRGNQRVEDCHRQAALLTCFAQYKPYQPGSTCSSTKKQFKSLMNACLAKQAEFADCAGYDSAKQMIHAPEIFCENGKYRGAPKDKWEHIQGQPDCLHMAHAFNMCSVTASKHLHLPIEQCLDGSAFEDSACRLEVSPMQDDTSKSLCMDLVVPALSAVWHDKSREFHVEAEGAEGTESASFRQLPSLRLMQEEASTDEPSKHPAKATTPPKSLCERLPEDFQAFLTKEVQAANQKLSSVKSVMASNWVMYRHVRWYRRGLKHLWRRSNYTWRKIWPAYHTMNRWCWPYRWWRWGIRPWDAWRMRRAIYCWYPIYNRIYYVMRNMQNRWLPWRFLRFVVDSTRLLTRLHYVCGRQHDSVASMRYVNRWLTWYRVRYYRFPRRRWRTHYTGYYRYNVFWYRDQMRRNAIRGRNLLQHYIYRVRRRLWNMSDMYRRKQRPYMAQGLRYKRMQVLLRVQEDVLHLALGKDRHGKALLSPGQDITGTLLRTRVNNGLRPRLPSLNRMNQKLDSFDRHFRLGPYRYSWRRNRRQNRRRRRR
ncbi:MAG: uncharacterized protein KVP18_003797 [Porospora cf. gigantea A]|uniref:uncharacterized protein n=2 Tax=Porospora cf. gigantea A TaxID=2853593 RepID=UPI003559B9C9|nr:MAG: hypothetical protein KVP18_003797 [Porospora cf. gigantea A]